MKKILNITLIIFALNINNCIAQDYEMASLNLGEDFDKREYISNILYGDENYIYAITSSNGFIAGTDNEHYFSKIDLKTKKSTVLATIGGKENYFDNNNRFGFELGNVVYFFYSVLNFDSKENELFVYSYDLATNKLIDENKKICSFSFKEGGKKNNGSFDFRINESTKSFVIVGFHPCPNAIIPTLIKDIPVVNKADIWIFNSNLSNPNISHIELDSKDGYQCDDFLITLDNTFYGVFSEVNKTTYTAYPELSYLVKINNNKMIKTILSKNEDFRLRNSSLLNIDSKIIIAGTYLYSGKNNNESGIVTLIINESNSISENLYPYWNLENIDNAYSIKTKIEQDKEVKFQVNYREIKQTKDNEFYFVLNRMETKMETEGIINGTLVINFNENGNLKWHHVIPNYYSDKLTNLAFTSSYEDNKILVYINDRSDEFKNNSLNKEDKIKEGENEFGYVSFNQESGEVSKKSLFRTSLTINPNLIINNSDYLIGSRIIAREEKLITIYKK